MLAESTEPPGPPGHEDVDAGGWIRRRQAEPYALYSIYD